MAADKILDEILDSIYLAKDITKVFPTFPENIRTSHIYVLYTHYQLGREARVSDIANKILITLPNITKLVNELETKGLVQKTPDKMDKRVILVKMTDEGYNLLDKYYLKYKRKIAEQLEKVDSKKYELMIDSIKELNTVFITAAKQVNLENNE
ncbi:MarR family transcriptional regulator [Listeria monocytogenes]|uniref:MarR family winged helix-turn-helix transcriptional regulator n=1 Tax=Listeria monocytogenes TaxID=1639 RepID=UPI0022FFE37D|nr:MarR family transcriptional regulator [Listeria monocytogenes]MDA5836317.1 MarR family transcriptional regulator [Listeria monocytogenes]